MRIAISFAAGVLLFVSIALSCGGFFVAHLKPPADTEGIISKTNLAGYPKHLDGFYFNLASLVVPAGAWLFWFWPGRKWKPAYTALFSSVWAVILIYAILKQ